LFSALSLSLTLSLPLELSLLLSLQLLANRVKLGFWEVITRAGLAGAGFVAVVQARFVAGFWQDLASVRSPPLNSLLLLLEERMQLAATSSEESSTQSAGPVMKAEARVTWG
jgi:hypothetical protein